MPVLLVWLIEPEKWKEFSNRKTSEVYIASFFKFMYAIQ